MSNAVETPAAVKPQNVNIKLGKVYSINLPNGSHLLIEGNTVTLPGDAKQAEVCKARKGAFPETAPVETAPAAAAAPVETPPAAAAAPVETPPAAAEKPAAEKPAAKGKAKGKSNGFNKKRNHWIFQDEFLGVCEYKCQKGWFPMVVISRTKSRMTVAFYVKVGKGDRAGELAVAPDAISWECNIEGNEKVRGLTWKA